MADETTGQKSTDEQDEQQQENQDQPKGGEEQKFDAAYVKGLRDEAAANRRKAKDLETRLKALEDEKLSDTEKKDRDYQAATKRAEDAEHRAHQAEVRAAAAAAGAVDPSDVAALVPADTEDVEKAIALLKKTKAYLFTRPGAGSADGGAGGAGGRGFNMNDHIRRAAGRS